MLEIALKAARGGMHIFPAEEKGKRPVMTPRGRLAWGEAATNDEAQIYDWWTHRCVTANIAVAAKHSGLLIVDCDMPKGEKAREWLPKELVGDTGVKDGSDAYCGIAELAGAKVTFDTLIVSTPSGGLHFYYRNLGGVKLDNSSLIRGWVDIRANGGDDGGYVIAPGSTGENGRKYSVMHRAPIAPAPDWLIQLCMKPKPAPRPTPPPRPLADKPAKTDGLVNNVRYAQEGNRNNALMWSACKYAEEGLHIADAEADLTPAALECGLSRGEILPTISSAYRKMGR